MYAYVHSEYRNVCIFALRFCVSPPGTPHPTPPPIVFLRVYVYTYIYTYVFTCRDETSMQHYYWQLRENLRIQWDPQSVPEERILSAVALALQADAPRPGDFDPAEYFPQWVR